jgi:hypothetical protein
MGKKEWQDGELGKGSEESKGREQMETRGGKER